LQVFDVLLRYSSIILHEQCDENGQIQEHCVDYNQRYNSCGLGHIFPFLYFKKYCATKLEQLEYLTATGAWLSVFQAMGLEMSMASPFAYVNMENHTRDLTTRI